MEQKPDGLLAFLAKEDRYFLALLGGFIVGLLLLFGDKAAPFVKNTLTPLLVVYTMGAALIGQVQMMAGEREKLRREAAGELFQGSPRHVFLIACCCHIGTVRANTPSGGG